MCDQSKENVIRKFTITHELVGEGKNEKMRSFMHEVMHWGGVDNCNCGAICRSLTWSRDVTTSVTRSCE